MSEEPVFDTGLVFDDRYLQHNSGLKMLPDGSAYPWVEPELHWSNHRLVQRTKQLLELSGVSKHITTLTPRLASRDEIERFHTPGYVARVERLSAEGSGDAGQGAPVGPGSFDVARLAAGGALTAVDAVNGAGLRRVFALVRPPGHHAVANLGMGFCIFNNVALAALHAREVHGLNRIVIVDWDVHHGNGTQDAFYDDDSVLFFSIHQDRLFPSTSGWLEQDGHGDGKGYTINIPLPPGSGDAAYLTAFDEIILPIIDDFVPELILVSAGQDASIMDQLGRMCVTTEGYRRLAALMVNRAVRHAEGRLVVLQEGGYSETYAPYATLAIIEAMASFNPTLQEPLTHDRIVAQPHHTEIGLDARSAIDSAIAHHRKHWDVLR
ncbi:MAG: class II histone deacetylase [Thermomicrobiales bacterium]